MRLQFCDVEGPYARNVLLQPIAGCCAAESPHGRVFSCSSLILTAVILLDVAADWSTAQTRAYLLLSKCGSVHLCVDLKGRCLPSPLRSLPPLSCAPAPHLEAFLTEPLQHARLQWTHLSNGTCTCTCGRAQGDLNAATNTYTKKHKCTLAPFCGSLCMSAALLRVISQYHSDPSWKQASGIQKIQG